MTFLFGGGGGGGGAPAPAPLPPPAPIKILPGVEKAKDDLRERLKRAHSRSLSRVTGPGLLEETPTRRPMLSERLG